MKRKLNKFFGLALAVLAKKNNKSTADIAKTLEVPEVDLEKFLKGETELQIEEGAMDDVAQAAGSNAGELAETALDQEAEAEKSAAEEAVKKAAEEEAAKKAADAKLIKEGKQSNGVKKFGVLPVKDDGSNAKKSEGEGGEPVRKSTTELIRSASSALFSKSTRDMLMKGAIPEGFISPASELAPEVSRDIMSLITDRAGSLFSKIQKRNMNRTSQNVHVWDISGRKFKRFAQGYWPTADTHAANTANKSIRLDAERVDMDILIPDDTIIANRDNWPAMEADIINGFTTQAFNELLDLCINGIGGGSAIETTWEELLTGWLARADDLVPAERKISYAGESAANPKDQWNAAIQVAAPLRKYFAKAELTISGEQWELHEEDLLTRVDSTPFLIDGAPMKYRRRIVNDIDYLENKSGFYCNPMNLVLGAVTQGMDGFKISLHQAPGGLWIRFSGHFATNFVNAEEGVVLFTE